MPTIVINLPSHGVTEDDLNKIREIMPDYDVRVTQDREECKSIRDDVEILAGWPVADLLLSAPNLRWYQQWAAGSDWLQRYPEAVERPFLVTNASGVHPIQIAEHVLALMLAFVRRLPQAIHNQAEHKWDAPPGETVGELYQRTLLVVGMGAIGERIARVANALGMRVSGTRRSAVKPPAGVEAIYTPDRLLDVLPQADFVVLAAPLTPETMCMIGEH
ncbi:MAG: NAD(P)-dependent oxidoreductase, partial [Nitrososphaerales archaeon]